MATPNKILIGPYEYSELAASFGPDMTGVDGPIGGVYYATGQFGNPPYEGAPEYQDMEITLPGVDGIGIKRMGFRGRPIFVRMAFVASNKTDCESFKNNFFDSITPLASFKIKLPGGVERPSCRIVHGSSARGEWSYAASMYILLVDVSFRQMRLS